jgi:uncharacterized membrane protein
MNKARLGFTIMGILLLLSWLSNTVSFLYENYPTLTISVIVSIIGVVVVLVPVILLMRAQREVKEELRKQQEEALRRKRLKRVL